MLQNMLLIGVVAVVLWGTVLPLVSGMLGQERVVGAAYYERAAGPLFASILALMALGPLLPWRRAGPAFLRAVRWPGIGAAAMLVLLIGSGVRSIPTLIAIPLATGVATTCLVEYVRAGRKLSRADGRWHQVASFVTRKRRRYGAYLAHLGLVVLVIGVAGSHFWQQEKDVSLLPGQQVAVGGYTLKYVGAEQRQLADHSELVGTLQLGDRTVEPGLATYAGLGGQSLTHVAISSSAIADVYVILTGTGADGSASFRIFINPLVMWIWAGGAIVILGVLLGNLGEKQAVSDLAVRRVRSPVPA